jgi:hypothetical protein
MRKACQARWQAAILDDLVSEIRRISQDFNEDEAEIGRILGQRDANVIKEKRIIACTVEPRYKNTIGTQNL